MDGQVLRLFRERSSYHGHELAATRTAYATGLPVPALKSVTTAQYCGARFPALMRLRPYSDPRHTAAATR